MDELNMNICESLEESILNESLLTREQRSHIEGCPRCRALLSQSEKMRQQLMTASIPGIGEGDITSNVLKAITSSDKASSALPSVKRNFKLTHHLGTAAALIIIFGAALMMRHIPSSDLSETLTQDNLSKKSFKADGQITTIPFSDKSDEAISEEETFDEDASDQEATMFAKFSPNSQVQVYSEDFDANDSIITRNNDSDSIQETDGSSEYNYRTESENLSELLYDVTKSENKVSNSDSTASDDIALPQDEAPALKLSSPAPVPKENDESNNLAGGISSSGGSRGGGGGGSSSSNGVNAAVENKATELQEALPEAIEEETAEVSDSSEAAITCEISGGLFDGLTFLSGKENLDHNLSLIDKRLRELYGDEYIINKEKFKDNGLDNSFIIDYAPIMTEELLSQIKESSLNFFD